MNHALVKQFQTWIRKCAVEIDCEWLRLDMVGFHFASKTCDMISDNEPGGGDAELIVPDEQIGGKLSNRINAMDDDLLRFQPTIR